MNRIIFILACICLSGCARPLHIVIDSKFLVIYAKVSREDGRLGRYEYWVRDNSSQGWRFISDQDLQVGQTLEIKPIR